MSWQAVAWASTLKLPPRDKFVLLMLCNHYNDEKGRAFMGQKRLASFTGYSRATVNAALRALEHEHGLITTEERRYPDGRNAPKDYYVHIGSVPPSGLVPEEIERRRRAQEKANSVKQLDADPGSHVKSVDTVTGARVKEIDTDRVKQIDSVRVKEIDNKKLKLTNRSLEPEDKNTRQLAKAEPLALEAVEATPQRESDPDELYVEIWNAHAGPLPKVQVLNESRRKLIERHRKEFRGRAVEIFTAAVKQVATEPFWIERGYGFANLLQAGKVLNWAEKYMNSRGMSNADRKLADTAAKVAAAIGGFDD